MAHTSKAEQEFRDQKERANAVFHSTIQSAIKLGEMRLRVFEARKGETQAIANTKVEVTKVKRNLRAEMRELREEANTQINWFWKSLGWLGIG